MMTFKIINLESLPTVELRDSTVIYFTYDSLEIYFGKDQYFDPFCFVETLPTSPISDILYITIGTGDVNTYTQSEWRQLATIGSNDMLTYLSNAGTSYFMKANYRYIDKQMKSLIIPYQNGTYQLEISKGKDVKIDSNMVLRYSPELKAFVTDGNLTDPKYYGLPYISDYKGSKTKTATTTISDGVIKTNVNISEKENNGLSIIGGGIYANSNDVASQTDFDAFMSTYDAYMATVEGYKTEIDATISEIGGTISETSIDKAIVDAMEAYKANIDTIVSTYTNVYTEITAMKENVTTQLAEQVAKAKAEITSRIDSSAKWSSFDGETPMEETVTFTSEEASIVGFTHLTITSKKITDTDVYYYSTAVTVAPSLNTDMTSVRGFTLWDETDDIYADNDSTMYLVEATSSGLSVVYGVATVESRLGTPTDEATILTVESVAGTATGRTILAVTPTSGTLLYYYLKAPTTIPRYNSIISSTYTSWDGKSEIALKKTDNGAMICVVEVTSDIHRVRAIGLCTLVVNTTES